MSFWIIFIAGEECPAFETRTEGLRISDLIRLCCFTKYAPDQTCRRIPSPATNAVFIVDMSHVQAPDLSCDDSGSYANNSSPSAIVRATYEYGKVFVNILKRKGVSQSDELLSEDNIYLVRRLYSDRTNQANQKLRRIITRVFTKNQLANYAVIQFLGSVHSSFHKPHGNSKPGANTFIRTKPSVLQRQKELARYETPKNIINIIDNENSGTYGANSPSDVARDRQQVYNIKKRTNNAKKSRNTGKVVQPDFSKLIALMDNNSFVKRVDFDMRQPSNKIYPLTFAATDNCLTWISTFCTPSSTIKSQLCIDMTYKVGPFYTTCVSFANPVVVHKSRKDAHPTFFLGMMTSTTRNIHDYTFLARQLKSRCGDSLIYGTDGELALETAFESTFPIGHDSPVASIHLRCFNHVHDDIKRKLSQLDIPNPELIIKSILGMEYNGHREAGLVDHETSSFYKAYERVAKAWPIEFQDYMVSNHLRLRPLKETLLLCMGKQVRIDAGLGNPPNKFNNQRAESMNSVLKESLGNIFVDQASVHDLVHANIVLPQEREMIKALYGQGEYRLAKQFKHLEVSPQVWRSMSEHQRELKIKKLFLVPQSKSQCRPILQKLAVQPEELGEEVGNLPRSLVKTLWEQAEEVLSHDDIRELQNGSVCIIQHDAVTVVTCKNGKFSCQCEQFLKLQVCHHVLVAADSKNVLLEVMSKYNYNPSHAIQRQQPSGAGEKKNKKPRKGQQQVFCHPIEYCLSASSTHDDISLDSPRPFQFKEIWHNDQPFHLINVKSIRKSIVKCQTCNCVLNSKNALPPYDILFKHEERYNFPKKDAQGNITAWIPTRSKMTCKFYCVKRTCLLDRHPYFWNGLIKIDDVVLLNSHVKFLQEELNFSSHLVR